MIAAAVTPTHGANAQATTASVSVSATFVDPAGVGRAAEIGLEPTARPKRGAVSALLSPGAYLITAPEHQSFSVAAAAPLRLEEPGGGNVLTAALEVFREPREARNAGPGRVTDTFRITGTASISSQTPGGLYTGGYNLTVSYE